MFSRRQIGLSTPSTPVALCRGQKVKSWQIQATPPKQSRPQVCTGAAEKQLKPPGCKLSEHIRRAPSNVSTASQDDIIDELSRLGASCELLTQYAREEALLLDQFAQGGGPAVIIPQEVREVALRVLHMMTNSAGLDASRGWFDAVLLVDAYCTAPNKSAANVLASMPSTCAAAVALLRKADASGSGIKAANVAQIASKAATCFQSAGFAVETAVTVKEMLNQEQGLLQALQWRVGRPNVGSWLTLLCNRMNIFSRWTCKPTLEWILTSCLASASTLVLRRVTYAQMAPKTMANGLFCVFLTVAGMIPLEALKPARIRLEDWQELYVEGQCQALPTYNLPETSTAGTLRVLELASGSKIQALQEDMAVVMQTMREIVRSVCPKPYVQNSTFGN